MNTSKIRVMIVEDSDVVREFLFHLISNDPRLSVAASCASAEEAIRLMPKIRPDVIAMDLHLPGMNGFEATRRIMADWPTPIVIVSASLEPDSMDGTMNALRAGALTVVDKPRTRTQDDYESLAGRICTQLAIMSHVKVIRRRIEPASSVGGAESGPPAAVRPSSGYAVLGVVASTGGPGALVEIFRGLSADFPLPILLVQHIASGFLDGFAAWITAETPFRALIARGGERPQAHSVYLAPVDHHLTLSGGRIALTRQEPVSAQRPSGTVLLQSLAEESGALAIGVVLTGMGDDGADGLLSLRKAGGYTLAEAESSAVVYGMPRAAAERGAAMEILPLAAIAARLRELASIQKITTRTGGK